MIEANWPNPAGLIDVAIEPKSKDDQDRLAAALDALRLRDATLDYTLDAESGQCVLTGDGEQHLDACIDRLQGEYLCALNVTAQQASYRERIRQPATVTYTHTGRSGGEVRQARVQLAVSPMPPRTGRSVIVTTGEKRLSESSLGAAMDGLRSIVEAGPLAGYPVIDLEISLIAATGDGGAANDRALRIAARSALREALCKARTVLVEPIMTVEVTAPAETGAAVRRELVVRGGSRHSSVYSAGGVQLLALVPMAGLFGFAPILNSLSNGEGVHRALFDHYAPVREDTPEGPDDLFPEAVALRPS